MYATLSVSIAIQAKQKPNVVLAVCCGVTAIWAVSGAAWEQPQFEGPSGFLDLLRLLTWYGYVLYLYKRAALGQAWQIYGFAAIAASVLAIGTVSIFWHGEGASYTLYSAPMFTRLIVSVCELLLIENLYLNLPENTRWHIALPCVLLGGLACLDILVVADTVLFRRPSSSVASARAIALIIVAPLLVLASSRSQRWRESVQLSRAAVFHSATLVLSGSVLLSLALVGEILRHLDEGWGWIAELSLVFSGLVGILLFLSSRSARSILDRVVIHHFFADRYDYRTQWLNCIGTLSGRGHIERTDLHTRAIQAIADVVNSPSGTIFFKDDVTGSLAWASSWNMPATTELLPDHPLLHLLLGRHSVIDLRRASDECIQGDPLGHLGPLWLAVPLLHSSGIIGVVFVGPPRVAFQTDQEVFDLLEIVGREVGTYLAEQQATQVIAQTRNLHEYGKRFAFVAHDIKNVSSQLALLLSNAEFHIENPEFQRDMLDTVRSAVQKIDRLLKRLDQPASETLVPLINPISQLETLLVAFQRVHGGTIKLLHDNSVVWVRINADAFETAMAHLLTNAIEAAPTRPVSLKVTSGAEHVVIDIIDHGAGMSAEFIRDELFSPFKTKKAGGSGIGAFQARELITEAGGQLSVISEKGVGTTMRVLFKLADVTSTSRRLLSPAAGE